MLTTMALRKAPMNRRIGDARDFCVAAGIRAALAHLLEGPCAIHAMDPGGGSGWRLRSLKRSVPMTNSAHSELNIHFGNPQVVSSGRRTDIYSPW